MATAHDIANSLIKRVKDLRRFEVEMNIPEEFRFDGPVPFDMKVSSDGLVTAIVYATNYEEAHNQLYIYLNSH